MAKDKKPKTITKITVDEGVPVGTYKAKFLRCEEAEGKPEFGPAYRWVFEVTEGPEKGKTTGCLTGTRFTAKTNAGKMLAQLQGKPLETGEPADLGLFVGQAYAVNVAETDGGSTKVDSVIKV